MIKTFSGGGKLVAVLAIVLSSFLLSSISFAQESCGNIILNGESTAIEDCANPFQATQQAPVDLSIQDTVITPNTDIALPSGAWSMFQLEPFTFFTVALYKKEGADYVFLQNVPDSSIAQYHNADIEIKKLLENEYYLNVIGEPVNWSEYARNPDLPLGDNYGYVYDFEHDYAPYAARLTTGNYVLVFTSVVVGPGGPGGPELSWMERVKNILLPKVYAQTPPPPPGGVQEVFAVPFTVNGGDVEIEPEVLVDDLILQYAPILYFHPDEDYFPMDVESYVEASALWEISDSTNDALVISSEDLTFDVFESFVDTGVDTSDMYLAFSSPEISQTIDLEDAKNTYDDIKKDTPTVYYTKMTDTTDYGKTFTVLQYWYFYAMNNWKDKEGFNDHEGDWESTFIFLNEAEEPEYVAYSSHLNDNEPDDSVFQHDSVRRDWDDDEVEKNGDRVQNYVALGSHADYFNEIDREIFPETPFSEAIIDNVSSNGNIINTSLFANLIGIPETGWTQYQGLWGTFTDKLGENGPQGPTQINVTGQTRFSESVEWAGLNNFFKVVVNTSTKVVEDTKQGVALVFDTAVAIGTEITIQIQYELISFGNNVAELNPLPFFWEITSSLDSNTFSTLLVFQYTDEAIEAIGGNEEELVVIFHNPETNTLEAFPSIVDTANNTVSATTTHFSRYLLGFKETEVETIEAADDETSTATSTDEIIGIQAKQNNQGRRIVRTDLPAPQVLGVSTVQIGTVAQLSKIVDRLSNILEMQVELSEFQRGVLNAVLRDVVALLERV